MVKSYSIGQEISALDKRTCTITRSGIVLLISGLVALIIAGIGYAIPRSYPGVNDFMIDVPALLIPSGGQFDSALSGFFSSSVLIAVPVIVAVCFGLMKLMQGERIGAILTVLVIVPIIFAAKTVTSVITDTNTPEDSTSSPTELVRQLIKDDKPAGLVAYLEKNSVHTSETARLLEYVKAQVSIRESKPDIDLIRKVVADYQRNPALKNTRDDVRYWLEMTAFKETITSPATRYAQGKLKKERFFTTLLSGGISISGIFVLLGGMLFLWGSQMKKRVAFIKSDALK
ncbi:klaC [Lonsdalea quercina]|uniref:klaC n=1 Tax=Lonsdalea quercina TaxID=71657 RepID=UPI00397605BF